MLIKILFEFTPFFKRKNFAKFEFISIQARRRLLIGVICFLLVDRSIAGGGGGGEGVRAYKLKFTVFQFQSSYLVT